MNIERNDLDSLNAELTIHLSPADYNERFEKALKDYRKRAEIPGFRPGHVPVGLVKKRYGKAILAEEINTVLQDAINNYVSEKQLNILGSPVPKESGEVGNWEEPGDFTFTYELGLAPEFNLNLDTKQSFSYFLPDLTDDLVEKQVKDYTRRFGKLSDAEESTVEDMIIVQLDEVNDAGETIEGGISNRTTVYPEYVASDTLRKQLTRLKKGDTVTIDPHGLTKNHDELGNMLGITHEQVHHLHNQVKLTVQDIRRITPAEFNQELFDRVFGPGNIATEEEFRSRVRQDLEAMFRRDADWMFKRSFADEIIQRTEINLPDAFLKRYIRLTNERPLSDEEIDHDYPAYSRSLRWQLIENRIIKEFGIKVSFEEAKDHVRQVMISRFAAYGLDPGDERLDEIVKETLSKRDEATNVYELLYENKIMEVVKSNCTIEEKVIPYDDFVHRAQH